MPCCPPAPVWPIILFVFLLVGFGVEKCQNLFSDKKPPKQTEQTQIQEQSRQNTEKQANSENPKMEKTNPKDQYPQNNRQSQFKRSNPYTRPADTPTKQFSSGQLSSLYLNGRYIYRQRGYDLAVNFVQLMRDGRLILDLQRICPENYPPFKVQMRIVKKRGNRLEIKWTMHPVVLSKNQTARIILYPVNFLPGQTNDQVNMMINNVMFPSFSLGKLAG